MMLWLYIVLHLLDSVTPMVLDLLDRNSRWNMHIYRHTDNRLIAVKVKQPLITMTLGTLKYLHFN